jgi:hypothetical protein
MLLVASIWRPLCLFGQHQSMRECQVQPISGMPRFQDPSTLDARWRYARVVENMTEQDDALGAAVQYLALRISRLSGQQFQDAWFALGQVLFALANIDNPGVSSWNGQAWTQPTEAAVATLKNNKER